MRNFCFLFDGIGSIADEDFKLGQRSDQRSAMELAWDIFGGLAPAGTLGDLE